MKEYIKPQIQVIAIESEALLLNTSNEESESIFVDFGDETEEYD